MQGFFRLVSYCDPKFLVPTEPGHVRGPTHLPETPSQHQHRHLVTRHPAHGTSPPGRCTPGAHAGPRSQNPPKAVLSTCPDKALATRDEVPSNRLFNAWICQDPRHGMRIVFRSEGMRLRAGLLMTQGRPAGSRSCPRDFGVPRHASRQSKIDGQIQMQKQTPIQERLNTARTEETAKDRQTDREKPRKRERERESE